MKSGAKIYLSYVSYDSVKGENRLLVNREGEAFCWLSDEHEGFCFIDLVIFGCQEHSTLKHSKSIERVRNEGDTSMNEKTARTVKVQNEQGGAQ
jgi:hypothetical protein